MKYIIKSENYDLWGISSAEEAIVDETEIEAMATEWEKPVEDLLEQVEEAYEVFSTCINSDGDAVISCDGAYYIGTDYSEAKRILNGLRNGILMRGE